MFFDNNIGMDDDDHERMDHGSRDDGSLLLTYSIDCQKRLFGDPLWSLADTVKSTDCDRSPLWSSVCRVVFNIISRTVKFSIQECMCMVRFL